MTLHRCIQNSKIRIKPFYSFQKLAQISGNCIKFPKFPKERIKTSDAIEMFKTENHSKTHQVVDATDGTRLTRKRRLRTLKRTLSLRTVERILKRTLSLRNLKRTLKKSLLMSTLKKTLSLSALKMITEDRKENPISEYPKKDPITEEPKRTQSNTNTTMQAIVKVIGKYR